MAVTSSPPEPPSARARGPGPQPGAPLSRCLRKSQLFLHLCLTASPLIHPTLALPLTLIPWEEGWQGRTLHHHPVGGLSQGVLGPGAGPDGVLWPGLGCCPLPRPVGFSPHVAHKASETLTSPPRERPSEEASLLGLQSGDACPQHQPPLSNDVCPGPAGSSPCPPALLLCPRTCSAFEGGLCPLRISRPCWAGPGMLACSTQKRGPLCLWPSVVVSESQRSPCFHFLAPTTALGVGLSTLAPCTGIAL